ncbi:hypothetical protein ASE66_31135 [Bosea sp. Root483D1]|uniref:LysR family transcriptional regulator n=1 Tax=Bosea sp. Root483D1 TaxID=1736544 RepID=UPI00070A72EE|nr:LysR family transcriptional regulator [Bosea sp. Root483D1]KRE17344.1 hypothetical protein ASE66_31135 [Bosea sp. Root483D1]
MRLSDIDLRLLRVFKAIVEARGLVGAQLTLNMAQSTVSTHLSELEKRLGFRLCHRGRAGFSLTRDGQQIYEGCVELFSAADRIQNIAASISGSMKGVLRIGMIDAVISNRVWNLPAIIRSFSEHASEVVIELKVGSSAEMEQELIEGKRDIVIGSFFHKRVGLNYIPVFRERQSIYCSLDHELASKKEVPVEELSSYPFLVRRYLNRYNIEKISGNIVPNAFVENMEAHAALILSGRFIGFLPQHYAEALPPHARLHRIPASPSVDYLSTFYIIYRAQGDDNILVRNFLNRVKENLPDEIAEA